MSDVPPEGGGGGGILGTLTMKIGPLALWMWVILAILAYWIYSKRKAAAQNQQQATTAASTLGTAVYDASGQEIGTITTDVQSTPTLNGDRQLHGPGTTQNWSQYQGQGTWAGQAGDNPPADSLSTSEGQTTDTTNTSNVTTPATGS